MTDQYLLTEALLRIERAASEYVNASLDAKQVQYGLLVSALQDMDDLRERIDADRKAARA